jgi:hypothetical protein
MYSHGRAGRPSPGCHGPARRAKSLAAQTVAGAAIGSWTVARP